MDTAQIRDEVERIQKRVEEWEAKIAPARQELQHWTEILRIRESRTQYLEGIRQQVSLIPVPEPATPESQKNHADGYGSKARALRAFLRGHTERGVTMAEMVAETVRVGSHKNAAYRFVGRLTEANPPELVRREDRIFPTENLKPE